MRMTRRGFGWTALAIGVGVGAAWPLTKLASMLADRSLRRLTPKPILTIDAPAPDARIECLFTIIKGRVVHETIRAPLWLLISRAGGAWEPQGPVNSSSGEWSHKVRLLGREGTRHRLAVIAAELSLANALKAQVEERPREEFMNWLRRRTEWGEAGVGFGTFEAAAYAKAPLGDGSYPPLPRGASPVASVDVVIGRDTDSCGYLRGP
jgi:hypothetical protein